MPADEYGSAVRGGLKLKGSSVSKPQGIKKKKKKSKDKNRDLNSVESSVIKDDVAVDDKTKEDELNEAQLRDLEDRGEDGKTATERAYEDMKRKRLQDRLQKEGAKTHKQRVEELNKYLSGLSEHHDMPRIGPG